MILHITVAMKPINTTFLGNSIEYGVSGLNIDGTRVPINKETIPEKKLNREMLPEDASVQFGRGRELGRFSANILLDDTVADTMDSQGSPHTAGNMKMAKNEISGTIATCGLKQHDHNPDYYGDVGGYSRVFLKIKST